MKNLHFARFFQNYTVIISVIIYSVKTKLSDFAYILQNGMNWAAAESYSGLVGDYPIEVISTFAYSDFFF